MKKKYSYRLKTSYGAYKRMIREAEDKGYEKGYRAAAEEIFKDKR